MNVGRLQCEKAISFFTLIIWFLGRDIKDFTSCLVKEKTFPHPPKKVKISYRPRCVANSLLLESLSYMSLGMRAPSDKPSTEQVRAAAQPMVVTNACRCAMLGLCFCMSVLLHTLVQARTTKPSSSL